MNLRSRVAFMLAITPVLLAMAGCGSYLPFHFESNEHPAPRIFNLSISPNQISGDSQTAVMIEFDYYDPDGDIGLDSPLHVDFNSDRPIVVSVEGQIDQLSRDNAGTGGRISKAILIDTTGVYDAGEITMRVAISDRRGFRSNTALGSIELLENPDARRLSACDIWFVDQPGGTPTASYRIGQEVFLMVEDLTLGVLEPDVLYAELSSPSSGWDVVVPFFRTADPHIYASRVGPRLGVNVPARSGQTLLAFYSSFSDRQEICLAQAKVF